jgi:hypothetical protein
MFSIFAMVASFMSVSITGGDRSPSFKNTTKRAKTITLNRIDFYRN